MEVTMNKKVTVAPRVTIVTDLLKNHNGHFVTTVHISKKGTPRKINGRFGVHKGVTGAGLNHDPAEHGQNTIAEIVSPRDNKGRFTSPVYQYRTVDFNTLLLAKFNGKTLVAKEAESFVKVNRLI
jgi:hypothetical protein